jgi:hypothetical protein
LFSGDRSLFAAIVLCLRRSFFVSGDRSLFPAIAGNGAYPGLPSINQVSPDVPAAVLLNRIGHRFDGEPVFAGDAAQRPGRRSGLGIEGVKSSNPTCRYALSRRLL